MLIVGDTRVSLQAESLMLIVGDTRVSLQA